MTLSSHLVNLKNPLFTFSLLLWGFSFSSSANASLNLKICHEASNYPPYIYQQDGQAAGLLVNIIQTSAKNLNIHVEFDAKPWKRCQKDVKEGKSHALFAMIKTPTRAKEYVFPSDENNHLWTAKYPVFTRNDAQFSLSKYSPDKGLGAPLGYVVWQKLKDRGWLSPFQYAPEQGLKMVSTGKLDGYVVERLIGLHLLYENQLKEKLIVSDENLLDTIWYLPFNQNFYHENQLMVDTFWIEINKVRQELKRRYEKLKDLKV